MADLPSVFTTKIQVEETRFKFAVSEQLVQKLGKLMNYLLDGYRIPPGSIQAFGGDEASLPPGWDVCDGRDVSRTGTYANLFTAIGTRWGIGDGSSTFNLPDLRGSFLRGIDLTSEGQKGADPNHASRTRPTGGTGTSEQVGSYQEDEFESHTHAIARNSGGFGQGHNAVFDATDPVITSATGGAETRPKNWYVLYIIKL